MNRIKFSAANMARCALVASVFAITYPIYAAADYQYIARTEAKAAAEQGPVKAGSLTWKCAGNECRISGPWAKPGLGACKALAQRVGRLASYGYAGHWLSDKELATCNAGVGESLPSPGISKTAQETKGEAALSSGVIQAPKGQLKEALPSPGVARLPSDSLPPVALGPTARIQLSRSELDSMARTLNRIGSQRYEYVLWRRTPTQGKRVKLSVVRGESIRGVLLNRDKAAMESLGGRFYDDHMGNLVLLGHLVDESGSRFPYSFTATWWGEGVFGADRDRDGVVDLALGSYGGVGGGRLWMMANDHFKRLWQCIEESALSTGGNDMFNAASLCVPCLDPEREAGTALTAEEISCVNRRRSGGGGGLLGSALGKGAPNLFGEPNCGASRTSGGGITRLDKDERIRGLREQALDASRKSEFYLLAAGRHLSRGEESLADMAAALGIESADFADGLQILADMIENDEDPEIIERTVEELTLASEEIIRHQSEYCAAGGSTGCHTRVEDDPSDGGGEEQPRIELDGIPQTGTEDPRCAGRTVAARRGSIWSDLCYEKGEHVGMLECIQRLSDSDYAITGGRCWQEPSPAGGEHTVCRKDESGPGDGSDGGTGPGGVGGSSSGPTEGPNLGPSSGAATRYIDTTPIGGFLLGICAHGGCPDSPPTDR